MAGTARLRKIQVGVENTPGTAVAATMIWRGPANFIADEQEVQFPPEDVGFLSGLDRTILVREAATLDMPETPATFEHLPFILMAGVATTAATTSGGTTAQTWLFTFATSGQPSVTTYTLEAGDNQQAHEMEYSFVEEFTLGGAQGEPLNVSATWRGRQKGTASFTGSLAPLAVEDVPFSKGKLYIDADSGNVGTTQVTATLISAELRVSTGLVAFYAGDGELYFTALTYDMPEILLDITFLYNASAVTEEAAWGNETARLIRLSWEGSELQSGTNKEVRVDLAGKWETFAIVGEQDGNDVVTGTFRARWNQAESLFAVIVVLNDDAALP